jgi:NO-binding membrane sensor protein with MHYT domain
MADHGTAPTQNAFVATYNGILGGMSWKAVMMGFVWSLSLTCMHYGGLLAMNIPEGRLTFNPVLVVISAIISWVVCIAGYIYMVNIEPHLSQQVLFSAIAASGIAAMHFTGETLCVIRVVHWLQPVAAFILMPTRFTSNQFLVSTSTRSSRRISPTASDCSLHRRDPDLHVGQWSAGA